MKNFLLIASSLALTISCGNGGGSAASSTSGLELFQSQTVDEVTSKSGHKISLMYPSTQTLEEQNKEGNLVESEAAISLSTMFIEPTIVTKTELLEHLNGNSTYYTHEEYVDDTSTSSEQTEQETEFSKCVEDSIKDAFSYIKYNGALQMVFAYDQSPCFDSIGNLDSEKSKYTSTTFVGCKGYDFSNWPDSLDGFSEAVQTFSCQNFEILSQGKSYYQYSYSYDDSYESSYVSYTYSKMYTEGGLPCEASYGQGGEYEYITSCTEESFDVSNTETTTTDQSGQKTTSKDQRVTYEKIVKSAGLHQPAETSVSQWFDGGTMDVTYNNWTVKLTYTDASTPPTYEATDGNETITGSLNPLN